MADRRPTTPPLENADDDLVARLAQEADRLGPPTRDIRYERRAVEATVADHLAGTSYDAMLAQGLERRRAQRSPTDPTLSRLGTPVVVILCGVVLAVLFLL